MFYSFANNASYITPGQNTTIRFSRVLRANYLTNCITRFTPTLQVNRAPTYREYIAVVFIAGLLIIATPRCYQTDYTRDIVSVVNVSVSRRSRDVFWNVSVSSRFWRLNVSSRLGLESLKKWNVSVSPRSCDLTSCGVVDITGLC